MLSNTAHFHRQNCLPKKALAPLAGCIFRGNDKVFLSFHLEAPVQTRAPYQDKGFCWASKYIDIRGCLHSNRPHRKYSENHSGTDPFGLSIIYRSALASTKIGISRRSWAERFFRFGPIIYFGMLRKDCVFWSQFAIRSRQGIMKSKNGLDNWNTLLSAEADSLL